MASPRSGEDSGELTGGGSGWINFGTITKPLPTTSMAPALFAVPGIGKILENR